MLDAVKLTSSSRYAAALFVICTVARSMADASPDEGFQRAPGGEGFSWNNTVNLKAKGKGAASTNDSAEIRLTDVTIDIDRYGKLVASFRTTVRGQSLLFTGQMLSTEGARWKADVISESALHGPMWISIDDRRQVQAITLEATDGRDRMRLNWSRR
jgi:hypothetical protein